MKTSKVSFPNREQLRGIKLPNPEAFSGPGSYLKVSREFLQKKFGRAFTQNNISEYLGFTSGQFLSNIERGLCAVPHALALELGELYGISRQTLFELYLKQERKFLEEKLLKL